MKNEYPKSEQLDKPACTGFAAVSRFAVANGMEREVKEAFKNRPHMVDSTPGFTRMEVMCPQDDPSEIWLLTFWTDEASFRSWHHSHLYHDSHKFIPKGLKLIPERTQIQLFDHICS